VETIQIKDIIVTDRQRKALGDLEKDFASVREVGLIQPVVLETDSETLEWRLVSGGRRLAWLSANGFTTLWHGTSCDPAKPGFVFTNELSQLQRQEAELYENLKRKSLSWQEECVAIAKVHRMRWIDKKAEGLEWSQQHTAHLLGIEAKAKVGYSLMIAEELMRDPDGPVSKAETYTDAQKILFERKDREARDEQQRRRQALLREETVTVVTENGEVKEFPAADPNEQQVVQVWLSNMLYHGDFVEIAKRDFPADVYSCALVFRYTTDEQDEQVWRLLKGDSFAIYFKFHHSVDFEVVLWNVLGLEPEENVAFKESIKTITIEKKGNPRPVCPSPTNVVTANPDGDEWPPVEVLAFLLHAVTLPGDSILMPTGGPVRRVLEAGRLPICFETDEARHLQNVKEAKEFYEELHPGNVEFR